MVNPAFSFRVDVNNKNFYEDPIIIIGGQPFARPAKQKGFALRLSQHQSLQTVGCIPYYFNYTDSDSIYFFEKYKNGESLWCKNITDRKASLIAQKEVISEEAFCLFKKKSIHKRTLFQTIKFLLPVRLSARQASRYYARPYTARKRAGRKNATEVKPKFGHHRGFRLFLSRPKGRGIKPNRIKEYGIRLSDDSSFLSFTQEEKEQKKKDYSDLELYYRYDIPEDPSAIVSSRFVSCCWAHVRRKFFDAREAGYLHAEEFLKLIGNLYRIEQVAKTRAEEKNTEAALFQERRVVRRESRIIVKNFFDRCRQVAETERPSSPVLKAINYALNIEENLEKFLDNPKLNIDNNPAERAIRGIAIMRKNCLFAGSETGGQNLAIILSFVETCRANKISFRVWLEDVLRRFSSTPEKEIDSLLPQNWKPVASPLD